VLCKLWITKNERSEITAFKDEMTSKQARLATTSLSRIKGDQNEVSLEQSCPPKPRDLSKTTLAKGVTAPLPTRSRIPPENTAIQPAKSLETQSRPIWPKV
jgi:hypothetical protein